MAQSADPNNQKWTVGELIRWATKYLKERRIPAPRLSAEVMLAQTLACQRVDLYLCFEQPLNEEELAGFKQLLLRRRELEPLAYITGRREFFGLSLSVGSGVLIPRPETEHLVEAGLERLAEVPAPRVLDLCTGSGAVALALAKNNLAARVTGVDSSARALAYARKNAVSLNLADRVELVLGSLYEPVSAAQGFFDLITANPPYINDSEWAELSPEVRDYEPPEALRGGEEGLDLSRSIVAGAGAHLRAGAWVMVELGAGQAAQAREMAQNARIFEEIDLIPDLAGIPRVLACCRGDYG